MATREIIAAVFFTSILAGSPAWPAANPHLAILSKGTVIQFSGTEGVSRPFAFDIEVSAQHPALNLSNIVGQPLQLNVAPGRTLSGMVERVEQTGGAGNQGVYRVRLVPAFNRLAYRVTSRTFESMSVIDVANLLLREAAIPAWEVRINGSPANEELVVQYQESDFAFVSRLLEGAGIHYHFESAGATERLVLGDSNAAFATLAGTKLTFGSQITAFARGRAVHSGTVQAGDYDWKRPAENLTAAAQAPLFADLREDVYPATVHTVQDSQQVAGVRLTARIAEAESCRGASTDPGLQAGFRFVLAGHPRADFNQEYVVTSVEHDGSSRGYRNAFTCVPATVVFRPSLRTPRPAIAGVLPGIVVGPSGERRHVDSFGRVRVRFPWRNPGYANSDGGDAGWVRVAQIATGGPVAPGTSSMWIPDIGDEVLVAFEHGDPRRPVIVGSVSNARDLPPIQLPGNKFVSVIRGRSTVGSINEIGFDDKAGEETLFVNSRGHRLIFDRQGVSLSVSDGKPLKLRAGNQVLTIAPDGITASSAIRSPTTQPQAAPHSPSMTIPSRPTFPKR